MTKGSMSARSVVLVTGASAGIGRATAERLHQSGRTIIGASRRMAPGVAWQQVPMDVDDDASVADGMAKIIEEHGGIDALVTCAGWGLAGPVETTPIDEARAQMETNFFGTVRCVTAALPSLRQRSGRIIVISSIGGLLGLRTTQRRSLPSRAGPRHWPGRSSPFTSTSPSSNPATSTLTSPVVDGE